MSTTNNSSSSFSQQENAIIERHNRVLSTVTHDLKSPMVAIMGSAKYMLREMREKPHDPQWAELLRRMLNAGEGMLEQIEDILAMAKMEAGSEKVEPEWADNLADELRDIIKTFAFEADAKGIAIGCDLREPFPPVHWDLRRLRLHVINNIMSNALKFTPRGGTVTLSAAGDGGSALIRIGDTGPGIPRAQWEMIFCRFEQAETKNRRVFKGAGLGLYNARLFVTRHGGTIEVETSNEQGTTFLIRLPLDAGKGLYA